MECSCLSREPGICLYFQLVFRRLSGRFGFDYEQFVEAKGNKLCIVLKHLKMPTLRDSDILFK